MRWRRLGGFTNFRIIIGFVVNRTCCDTKKKRRGRGGCFVGSYDGVVERKGICAMVVDDVVIQDIWGDYYILGNGNVSRHGAVRDSSCESIMS
mmetsp:Transcript_27392/g.46609  ORF Transcript_27392/g.46609 Transcript_27392/m.46609 type:complete len:93 (-) Transcript_27392:139-417(-)